jgi:hypothetical protein
MGMMNGSLFGGRISSLAAKYIVSYKDPIQFAFCLSGCGSLVSKTSISSSFGYSFGIGSTPGICCSAKICSCRPTLVLCVWKMWWKTSNTSSLVALPVMLAGLIWEFIGTCHSSFRLWCCMLGFISTMLSPERYSSLVVDLYGAIEMTFFYAASLSFSQWKRFSLVRHKRFSLGLNRG